ncbi:ATP-binding SpoIIE family protein phosphatase [Ramlibacter tataouinensis]|uniref:Signal transduction protein, fusion protein: serine/threonine protein kinase phosphoserine phosphatase-like protein n=1 Tax=Ramlibacter tataouinensis (strain ATCC BAA-407 / DSM 14655 / LMG 21543 / TTB310) TaxID=365046 RepID=F5XZV8_RAMTT|nr:ATP-binding SpoIIE family protein phosphatase [Ramlibacter tataouinensis]AEG93319.1 signal transduction protein, fusion protein : serine/threonine protein kinase; phosphoserine phosphatase-like protein [Ramlibacter tataouinensis TTB310]
MEVITGRRHLDVPVGDPSRVGEARRHAAQLARECGLDEVEAGRLAIIVNELGTNLLRHATDGRLLLGARPDRREVEVLAIDRGPGIGNLDRCMGDGYSTAGTPGTGLGAVRRQADVFDIHSQVPSGTIVLARVHAAGLEPGSDQRLCAAAVSVPAPGERVCGDAWAFALDGDRAAVLVTDGLGHGVAAAEAAQHSVEEFMEEPLAPPRRMLERAHARLRSTRGAALMALHADNGSGTVRSCGAGNVVARLVSGTTDRTLLTQHGTVGLTIRTPEETSVAWPPHALLVVCSDGIETRWKPELLRPVLGRDPAIAAALLLRDHCRGRDDATVAVLRRKD